VNSLNDYLIKSPITHIDFCGFRSTTLALQNSGWSVNAYQRRDDMSYSHVINFMLNHGDLGLTLLTNSFMFDMLSMLNNSSSPTDYLRDMSFQVCGASLGHQNNFIPNIMARPEVDIVATRPGSLNFNRINCEPQMQQIDLRTIDLSKFALFNPINSEANIYVPKASANELLDILLEKQAPKQAEIRKKRRRESSDGMYEIDENSKPNDNIMAQIIAI